MKNILVCVAWPYANGPLHIGHIAGAYLPADVYVRYKMDDIAGYQETEWTWRTERLLDMRLT